MINYVLTFKSETSQYLFESVYARNGFLYTSRKHLQSMFHIIGTACLL